MSNKEIMLISNTTYFCIPIVGLYEYLSIDKLGLGVRVKVRVRVRVRVMFYVYICLCFHQG